MVGVRQFDEDMVLRTALNMFVAKGLQQTTMSDIVKATGVLRGSLYNAYGGKDAIYHRAFDLYRQDVLASFAAALGGDTLHQVLSDIFDAAIRNMRGEERAGCLTTRMALDATCSDAAVQDGIRSLLADLEQLFSDKLADLEEVRASALPAQEIAQLIITFTRGLAVIDRLYNDPARLQNDCENFVAGLHAMVTNADNAGGAD